MGTLRGLSFGCNTVADAKQGAVTVSSVDVKHIERLGRLGAGGFATVDKAVLATVGGVKQDCAVKEVSDEPIFKHERDQILAVMSRVPQAKQHFVTLCGVNDASRLLLFDMMAGGDLAAYLPQLRSPEARLKLRLLLDIAWAMKLLHSAGILHCDLKPGNLLLVSAKPVWKSTNPLVKIHDLGVARDEKSDAAAVRGDPSYKAPEVTAGKKITRAADVFSFGVLAFEVFTGWQLKDFPSTERSRILEGYKPSGACRGELLTAYEQFAGTPPAVGDAVRACWNEKPEDRPSFAQLATIFALELGLQPLGARMESMDLGQPAKASLSVRQPLSTVAASERKGRSFF